MKTTPRICSPRLAVIHTFFKCHIKQTLPFAFSVFICEGVKYFISTEIWLTLALLTFIRSRSWIRYCMCKLLSRNSKTFDTIRYAKISHRAHFTTDHFHRCLFAFEEHTPIYVDMSTSLLPPSDSCPDFFSFPSVLSWLISVPHGSIKKAIYKPVDYWVSFPTSFPLPIPLFYTKPFCILWGHVIFHYNTIM